jgi:thiol-disulfide isomerase/thioredoxin
MEDGKPVIRLFSVTWCQHCIWIKESFDMVAREYAEAGRIKAYHWELDTGDNTLTPETEAMVPTSEVALFREFSPKKKVPAFVFGCRYHRIGNAYESQGGLEAEKAEFRAVIESLLAE